MQEQRGTSKQSISDQSLPPNPQQSNSSNSIVVRKLPRSGHLITHDMSQLHSICGIKNNKVSAQSHERGIITQLREQQILDHNLRQNDTNYRKITNPRRDSRNLGLPVDCDYQKRITHQDQVLIDNSQLQTSVAREFPQHTAFLQQTNNIQSLVPRVESQPIIGKTPFIFIDLQQTINQQQYYGLNNQNMWGISYPPLYHSSLMMLNPQPYINPCMPSHSTSTQQQVFKIQKDDHKSKSNNLQDICQPTISKESNSQPRSSAVKNMESKDVVVVEITSNAKDKRKTISQVDVAMSSEIERRPINVQIEEEKVEISSNLMDSNTKASTSAELIFHKKGKNNKKVTFQDLIRSDKEKAIKKPRRIFKQHSYKQRKLGGKNQTKNLYIVTRLNHQIKRTRGRTPKRTNFTISGETTQLGDSSNHVSPMEHEIISRQLLAFTDGSVQKRRAVFRCFKKVLLKDISIIPQNPYERLPRQSLYEVIEEQMGKRMLKRIIQIVESIKSQPHRVEAEKGKPQEDIDRAHIIMNLCYSYRREWLERLVCDNILRITFEIAYPFLQNQGSKTYDNRRNNRKTVSPKYPWNPSPHVKCRTFNDELLAIFEIVQSIGNVKKQFSKRSNQSSSDPGNI